MRLLREGPLGLRTPERVVAVNGNPLIGPIVVGKAPKGQGNELPRRVELVAAASSCFVELKRPSLV